MAVLRNLRQDQDELERLRREVAELKARPARSLSMKIGEKGGLSIYGMGRFPVTLYKEQWETLLSHKEAILEYIAANAGRLRVKD